MSFLFPLFLDDTTYPFLSLELILISNRKTKQTRTNYRGNVIIEYGKAVSSQRRKRKTVRTREGADHKTYRQKGTITTLLELSSLLSDATVVSFFDVTLLSSLR